MRRLRMIAAILLGTLVCTLALIVIAAVGTVYALSSRRLNRTYPVPSEPPLTIPTDSASIARGEHLTRAFTCTACHGDDAGGAVYMDAGPMGVFAGPNLTRGRGGVATTFTAIDWERAIRHGVRRDGTSLVLMPSEVFAHLSDADVGAIVAYLTQLPPIDREGPGARFGPLGRALLAVGKLNILVAPKTPCLTPPAVVRPEPTREYGRYIADVSGCHGCHGYGLSGGRIAGPPGIPVASNLTPTGIGTWSEADFVRAMREGRRPDGSAIDEFMPWRIYSRMNDEELRALWLHLRNAPPKAFGNK